MLQEKDYLTIKDVAEMLDTEAYVLRFYEKELHLNINRNDKGHRVYTLEDVEIFKKIQDMREQGLQLKAIENVLNDGGNEFREETKEVLNNVQLKPVVVKKNEVAPTINITDEADPTVQKFNQMMYGNMLQAVLDGGQTIKEQIKVEVKGELTQEITKATLEQVGEIQKVQDAKNEEYYKKIDETIREVQRMRKQMGIDEKNEQENKTKDKKDSLWNKFFKKKEGKIEI